MPASSDYILIVDDQPVNLKFLSTILTKEGYQVQQALSGKAALELASQLTPNLVILDIMMPEMDGYEVCQRLQDNESLGNTPIIFVSAREDVKDKVRGLTIGGVDYIVKPFYSDELLARVRLHLSLQATRHQLEKNNRQLQQEISERKRVEGALRQSEEHYRTLVEHSPDVILRYDRQLRHLFASEKAATFFGRGASDIIGKTCRELDCPWEKVQRWEQKIWHVFEARQPQEIECHIEYPGGPRHLHWYFVPECDEDGAVATVLAVVRDITVRKRISLELEATLEAEREQRLLAETLSDVTLALTSQMSQTDVLQEILRQMQRLVAYRTAHIVLLEDDNLRIACWHGYEPFGSVDFISQLVQPLADFPLDAEIIRTRQPKIISDTHEDDNWVVQPDTAWVRSHLAVPIFFGDQVLGTLRLDADTPDVFSKKDADRLQPLARIAAIALDKARLYDKSQQEIAERRQAEQALRDNLEFLQILLDTIPNPVFYKNGDGIFHGCNAVFADQIVGLLREEIIGSKIDDFSEDIAVRLANINQDVDITSTGDAGAPVSEIQMQDADGQERQFVMYQSAYQDSRKRVAGVVSIMLDISEYKLIEAALRESVTRYHSIFEDSPISLWVDDFTLAKNYIDQLQSEGVSDFRTHFRLHPESLFHCFSLIQVIDVNQTTLDLFQAQEKTDLYQGLDQILPEEGVEVFISLLVGLIEGHTHFEAECPATTLTGKPIHTFVSVSVPPGFEDTWSRAFVSIVDVTRVKEAEEIWRRYEFIVNTSQELMTLIDRDHRYAAASKAFCQAHLRARSEIVGSAVSDLWGEERYEQRLKHYLDFAFAGNEMNYERCVVFPTSEQRRCLDVTFYPYRNIKGDISHVVVVSKDITAHKDAEIALKQAGSEKEQLIKAIPSILIGLNKKNYITHWNKQAEQAFGISYSEVAGRRFTSCNIQWQWSEIKKALVACRVSGQNVELPDFSYIRADGKEGFLKMIISSLMPEKKVSESDILLLAQDITSHKVLESQLAQAQKLKAVGQLAAGIAHEINTPTQYIGDNLGFLQTSLTKLANFFGLYQQLLEASKSDGATAALARQIEEYARQSKISYLLQELPLAAEEAMNGVNRVSEIVRAIREFSHPGIKERATVDINRAIESTITIARNEWKYCADVETDFDSNLPLVTCLPSEFNQVILNILVNAAHSIAEVVDNGARGKGKITVTTRRLDDWVEVRITDTGTGIRKDIHSKIFDPFFTTKDVGKGTGQGLAISHTVIVEKHRGTIEFESEEGQGTTFVIRIPIDGG